MTRRTFRTGLWLLLFASGAFAVWTWTRPYEWRPDPKAGCRIVAASLERDRSYHWLDIRLRVRADATHDLLKPVRLETAKRKSIEPADTTLAGTVEKPIDELFFRFWLEPGELDGPITLHLNDGSLSVRTGSGEPRLDSDGTATFNTRRW